MSTRKKLQENLLTSLWRLVSAHPGAVIVAGLILAVLSASISFMFLRLNSNQEEYENIIFHSIVSKKIYIKIILPILKKITEFIFRL